MSVQNESLDPDVAMAHIDRAEALVRSGHRWRAGSCAALGLVTMAWFAAWNWSYSPDPGETPFFIVAMIPLLLLMTPILVAIFVALFHGRYEGVQSREVRRRDTTLALAYAGLFVLAALLTTLLPYWFPDGLYVVIPSNGVARPYSYAVLFGVPAAVPCFVGAWQAIRR